MVTKKLKLGIAAAMAGIAAVLVYLFNPEHAVWMPKCPVFILTGIKCPSCGNTRAAYHYMHGHWAEAFAFNPFMPIALPLCAAIVYLFLAKPAWAPKGLVWKLTWVYLALYCIWFVLRNLLGL